MAIHCKKCKCPINLVKARRRYIKKYKKETDDFFLGLCACGEWIINKEHYRKMYDGRR